MMKKFLVLFSWLICSSVEMLAQQASFEIIIHNKNDENPQTANTRETVEYGYYSTEQEAQKVKREWERLNSDENPYADYLKMEAEKSTFKKRYKIFKSYSNGTFIIPAMPGFGVVVITSDNIVSVYRIREGQTNYRETIDVMRMKGVTKTRTRKRRTGTKVVVEDLEDGYEYFKLQFYADPEDAQPKDQSRLIFQLSAVDCQTEDTVAFLSPIIYEGAQYHELQDKRKGFDFHKYDPLAKGYSSAVVLKEGESIEIDTTVAFKKPDKKRHYKGPFWGVMEDYHHVYYNHKYPGTCLRVTPFKFLDFGVALAPIELTEDYHEVAQSQISDVPRNLDLRFEVGKDVLIEDSTYDQIFMDLEEEMRRYGKDLIDASITGYASPEGNPQTNKALAERRANRARSLVRIPSGSKAKVSIDAKVDTWAHTADILQQQGHIDEATIIRETIEKSGENAVFSAVRSLENYKEVIEPALAAQRRMIFNYRYFAERVMTPEEAIAAYRRDPNRTYSNGDYFNIYKVMTDSAEQDALTLNIYNKMIKVPDYQNQPFAPYVINRKALIDIRRAQPDSMVLKPLIDEYMATNADKVIDINFGTKVRVNLPQVIQNQALIFFQLQNIYRAKEMLQKLKDDGFGSENIQKLEHFINFKLYYPHENELNDEQQAKYEAAKTFIENSGPDNKAILYTELTQWNREEEAWDFVELMSDDNPRKWYLKGLLWSRRAGKEEEYRSLDVVEQPVLPADSLSAPQEIHVEEDDDVDITGIPYYLAYFQHCFDMRPDYAKFYFNEGHIDEEQRKKFPYKTKNIPAYRKVFRLNKKQDDMHLQELKERLGIDQMVTVPLTDGGNTNEQPAETTQPAEAAPAPAN